MAIMLIQFGPPIKPTDVQAGEGFVGNGMPEKDIFYFHSDHLGSSSYITTVNGQISQHAEYIAFNSLFYCFLVSLHLINSMWRSFIRRTC